MVGFGQGGFQGFQESPSDFTHYTSNINWSFMFLEFEIYHGTGHILNLYLSYIMVSNMIATLTALF